MGVAIRAGMVNSVVAGLKAVISSLVPIAITVAMLNTLPNMSSHLKKNNFHNDKMPAPNLTIIRKFYCIVVTACDKITMLCKLTRSVQ